MGFPLFGLPCTAKVVRRRMRPVLPRGRARRLPEGFRAPCKLRHFLVVLVLLIEVAAQLVR